MFEEEGYQLMGAAFEVYNELGYGMKGGLQWKRFILSDLHPRKELTLALVEPDSSH